MNRKQVPGATKEGAQSTYTTLSWIEAVPGGLDFLMDTDRAVDAINAAMDMALGASEPVYPLSTGEDEDGKPGFWWNDEAGNSWFHAL